MTKYSIEGNIDFYAELYKSLDEGTSEENKDDEVCLISNMPLTENYVTLECKHKFNYVPLFKDLVNRKSKLASLDVQILRANEIRCPYCRNKEAKLLPYYENMGVEKVHGINYIDESKIVHAASSYFSGTCSFKATMPDNTELCCHSTYVCSFEDGKDYCHSHIRMLQRKIMKDKLLKKKEEEKKVKLEAKLKEKEEKQKVKAEAKQKAKEEKQKVKEENQMNKKPKKVKPVINLTNDENVVISSSNGCKQLLKTGIRKGQMCGCKIVNGEMCGRHLIHKKEII
jgi:hypothetical protein